jgi:tetratricopeptide (TPR) repeat protein
VRYSTADDPLTIPARRVLAVSLTCVLLASCAGGKLQQPADEPVDQGIPEVVDDSGYIELEAGIEADFEIAVSLMENDDFEPAITKLESVVEREQRLIAPFINLAIAYRKTGEYERAEEQLSQALAIDPRHPVANNELGLVYRKSGRFTEARAAYEKAIASDPEFAAAIRNLGVLCDLYLRDFDCALEHFEQYLELKPDDEDVPIWIADLKYRTGQ